MGENPVPPVGYRFHPTDEELINHYLKNKILGKPWLIDEGITEININTHDPDSFRSLSKMKSKDSTYYFFAPTIYTTAKKTARKRSTRSGFWKPTGKDRKVKDKSGKIIGEKKTLVYYEGRVNNGSRTRWVMHEYLIKHWSHPDPESYVMCKIKYKGEEGERDIPSSSVPSQSLVSEPRMVINTPPEVEQQLGDGENGLSLNEEDGDIPPSSSAPSQSLVFESNTVRTIVNTPPEVEQPVEDENGLSLNDLERSLNEQVDPSALLGDNNNANVQQPQQTPYLDQDGGDFLEEFGLDMLLDNNNNNNARTIINTPPEVEQQLGDEEENGLSLNDFTLPMNEQVDPNALLSNNNNNNANVLLSDDYWNELLADTEDCFSVLDSILQEDRNNHKPRKPLSGIIVDCDSDSDNDNDAESISVTSYQGTLSPVDSVGSLNKDFPILGDEETLSSTKDLQKNTETQLTRCAIPLKQEDVSRTVDAKTEKKGLFIIEEAMEKTEKKNLKYIYLMKMIIGLILLLALVGNIVSVLSIVKT